MNHSTRRMELALPHFQTLDLGAVMGAQARLEAGDPAGLSAFIATLAATANARAIRTLAALSTATDIELRMAETDPKIMAALIENAADKPFGENFKAAMDFLGGLFASLGITPSSSEPPEQPKRPRKPRPAASDDSLSDA